MDVTIYHNPKCSKSRQTLALIRERGIEPVVVEYLKTPPGPDALAGILDDLGLEPRGLMRSKEAPYGDNNLAAKTLDRDALIAAMIDAPILIERPIVRTPKGTRIGRPPEAVLEIL
jgi:arsenate reductase